MKTSIKVSVIIPTYNRASLLKMALNSIIKQEFNKENYEVIVVDNASTDNTREVVSDIIAEEPNSNIKYFFEEIPGMLSGRHRGAMKAQGNILIFIDDDIEAAPLWLNSIYNSFSNEKIHLVGGRSLPKYEVNPPYWIEYLWSKKDKYKECGYYSLIDQGDRTIETDPNLVWGLNFAIRKKTLFELGGFHPDCIPESLQRFQGDGETGLTMKIKKKGLKALYNPNAVVYHQITKERMTFEYIEKRAYYQGVCQSFTNIRNKYLILIDKEGENIEKKTFPQKNEYSFFQRVFRRILARDLKDEIYCLKKEITILKNSIKSSNNVLKFELLERMNIAFKRGYEFHQNEVNNDPELLKWVLKENYFNYKLPNMP